MMGTPQNIRLQSLKSGGVDPNISPLRRRSMLNISTSMLPPDVNNDVSTKFKSNFLLR